MLRAGNELGWRHAIISTGALAGVPGHPKRSAATPQAAALQNIAGLALVIDHEPVEWRDCRLRS